MAWHDTKQAAVDPDNPAANEQFPFSEHNAMVTYLKDKLIGKTVDDTAIGNDKVLVYKTATSTFVFEAQSAVAAIDDLTDVTISGVPADDEVLAYDTGTSEWINQTAAEAGLATVAGLAAYYPLTGATMAGAMNMGGQGVTGANQVQAYDSTGVRYTTNLAVTKINLAYDPYSFQAYADADLNSNNLINVLDPTSAQHASTKNYDDTHLFTKEAVTSFTDGYIPVYRTASGKFEMEEISAAMVFPVADTISIVKGSADATKMLRFEVDGLTPSTTRTATMPDKDITLCDTAEAMLLTGGTMAGNLNMGDYLIDDVDDIQAFDTGGIVCRDSTAAAMITLATTTAAFKLSAEGDVNGQDLNDIGALILNDATELTIATGVVTATQSYHTIDTESDDATDDLLTISGGTAGMKLTIRAIDSARTVVAKDGTGNLQLEGDMSLDNAQDTLSLIYDGTNWLETGRANNGA